MHLLFFLLNKFPKSIFLGFAKKKTTVSWFNPPSFDFIFIEYTVWMVLFHVVIQGINRILQKQFKKSASANLSQIYNNM